MIRLKRDGTVDRRCSQSKQSEPRYLPTPKEIAAKCSEIRSKNLAKLEAADPPRRN